MPSYTPGAMTVFEGSESICRSFLPAETGFSVYPFITLGLTRNLEFGGMIFVQR